MSYITPKPLLLSLAIMCIGSAGGWAITDKISGPIHAYEFVCTATIVVFLILLVQGLLYIQGRGRLYFKLLFAASFSLSLAWFMMCLALPLAWVNDASIYLRIGMFALIVPLSIGNIMEASRRFSVKWAANGAAAFDKVFKREQGSVNWDAVTKALKIEAQIYIPGLPKKLTSVASILIVPAMLLGLSLRSVYPELSLFAWGIPALLIVSFFFQLAGYSLAQARTILELEKKIGQEIK